MLRPPVNDRNIASRRKHGVRTTVTCSTNHDCYNTNMSSKRLCTRTRKQWISETTDYATLEVVCRRRTKPKATVRKISWWWKRRATYSTLQIQSLHWIISRRWNVHLSTSSFMTVALWFCLHTLWWEVRRLIYYSDSKEMTTIAIKRYIIHAIEGVIIPECYAVMVKSSNIYWPRTQLKLRFCRRMHE